MKAGRWLGGGAPRRGGRLTAPNQEKPLLPIVSTQVVAVGLVVFLVLGIVAGYIWALERQLRGGLLAQRVEAQQRSDWVAIQSVPDHVIAPFILVADPWAETNDRVSFVDRDGLPDDLVRQVHLLGDGLSDRARQLLMTPLVEQHLDTRELVELYLNRVYLGESAGYPVYGIGHAAREYFGKSPAEMTLSESASLAGLLLEPRIENPEDRAGAVGVRRNEVLRSLMSVGRIDARQFEQATAEPLGFQPGLEHLPVTRRIPSPADTMVIRLPRRYLESTQDPDQDE